MVLSSVRTRKHRVPLKEENNLHLQLLVDLQLSIKIPKVMLTKMRSRKSP